MGARGARRGGRQRQHTQTGTQDARVQYYDWAGCAVRRTCLRMGARGARRGRRQRFRSIRTTPLSVFSNFFHPHRHSQYHPWPLHPSFPRRCSSIAKASPLLAPGTFPSSMALSISIMCRFSIIPFVPVWLFACSHSCVLVTSLCPLSIAAR